VLAHVGDAGADVDFLHRLQRDEVDDGDGAVGGGDVGVNAQAGTEEGGAMFAEEDDEKGNEQDGEQEVEAEAFEVGHWIREFYMRGEVEWKLVERLAEIRDQLSGIRRRRCAARWEARRIG
jgi:hypothetical protein